MHQLDTPFSVFSYSVILMFWTYYWKHLRSLYLQVIKLNVKWVPMEQNQIADSLSKSFDFDDWGTTDASTNTSLICGFPICTKNKVFLSNFFSKCDQIRRFLRIWSHLLKKFLMENFIFCAVRWAPCSCLKAVNLLRILLDKSKIVTCSRLIRNHKFWWFVED